MISKSFSFKIFVLIGLIFSSNSLVSQDNQSLFYADSASLGASKQIINYNSNAFFNSSSVSSQFPILLLQDLSLSQKMVDRATSKLNEQNGFLGEVNNSIEYLHRMENYDIFFSLGNSLQTNASFRGDMLNTVFNGNAEFEDDTAFFAPTNLNLIQFNSINLGLRFKLGQQITAGFMLSYLQAIRLRHISVTEGYLYTAPDGVFVSTSLNMRYRFIEDPSTFRNAGSGAASGFFLSFPINNWQGKIMLSNIGSIKYKEKANLWQIDTAYTHSGTDVGTAFSGQSGGEPLNVDSTFAAFQFDKSKSAVLYNLPFKLSVEFDGEIKKYNIQTKLILVQYNLPDFTPIVIIEGKKKVLKDKIDLGVRLGYGGFGQLQAGMSLGYKTGPLNINIGSNAIYGLVAKGKYGNNSAFLNLQYDLDYSKP